MAHGDPDTDELLDRSAAGDAGARGALLMRHRARLKRMVAIRLDKRLAPRVDPSDVVQEVIVEASRRLDRFLAERPLPFYPWLREIAQNCVIQHHRRHRAARRDVSREEAVALPEHSALELAERLFTSASGPSRQAQRAEYRAQVSHALTELSDTDRKVLELRHLEQLSVAETASVLGITESAVKQRNRRALQSLSRVLSGLSGT